MIALPMILKGAIVTNQGFYQSLIKI